jgi:hypothetical protein
MLMHPEMMDEMKGRFDANLEIFLSGFKDDGMCMEGCHYWPAELLEAGADVNAINNDGETPLDWAKDGWTTEHTRQFRKSLKQMGALSGKELKRGGKWKNFCLHFLRLGHCFLPDAWLLKQS